MANVIAEEYACDVILRRIRDEILPLFDKAIHDDDIYFENTHVPHCWEVKNCTKTACPVYGNPNLLCWQTSGTYCGGKVQGKFAEKHHNCKGCEVYKKSCPTLVEELGEGLNNLLFLLRKEKKTVVGQMNKIEYLNKELLSSLESLDNRNREIQELVITDKLTGLYNRHYLTTVLDDELHRCQRPDYTLCVMMIDLDDFKSVNDTYGHVFGDEMLVYLGGMLKANLRPCDRSFRYGGEEFVVVLPNTNLTIAWIVAERMRKTFEEKVFNVRRENGTPESVSRTLSFGLISYERGMDIETLLNLADEALYKAKTLGKNRIVKHGID